MHKQRRNYTLQFILEYDAEFATSIHTNCCSAEQLRKVYICNKTVRLQGAALWHSV